MLTFWCQLKLNSWVWDLYNLTKVYDVITEGEIINFHSVGGAINVQVTLSDVNNGFNVNNESKDWNTIVSAEEGITGLKKEEQWKPGGQGTSQIPACISFHGQQPPYKQWCETQVSTTTKAIKDENTLRVSVLVS